ncbi:cell division protein ZapA [Yoonia maricola]|uniref:Cell division protein ZapA n=1 Tax=Yoonia maricola TaxID=420999 RepID=A0A2M8WL24_9RHOB|nr:cell division protein ZapA [Yoonia maricola]PJI91576.1 cell division protein ZapA [Yoonia maricola]
MPQVEIAIGGRTFEVACQEGEEHFLHSAAAMLDTEAAHLADQIGRVPEARMLLMAGLMLADKTAGLEDRVRELETEAAKIRADMETMESQPAPEPMRVEVPVVPTAVTDALAEIAARAEALADQVEARQ